MGTTRLFRSPQRTAFLKEAAWIIVVSVIVLGLSQIPYTAAARHTPANELFLGQIAVADDINSYYSFIRQAAQGHWLFQNRMTYIDHAPAFMNLEWFVLGQGMYWFGWSPRTTFDVWRIAGVLFLIGAFAALARIVLKTELQRRAALMMCAIGGGFGWFLTYLMNRSWLSHSDGPGMLNPALDLYAGIQPFVQITRNPHFSLPHGTFIITCIFIILAERRRKASLYGIAAIATVIHGLIRPYDLISLYAMLPSFILVESLLNRKVEWRWNFIRCLPLIGAAPVLLYYVYLFSRHDVFKYWASQGDQPFVPLHWHLCSLGLGFVLFGLRLARYRSRPLATPEERFLVIWALSILVLFHSYKVIPFMPYTPQLGVPMMTPILLLGASILPMNQLTSRTVAFASILVLVNALSTPVYLRQESLNAPQNPLHYFRFHDLDAADWLNRNARESDVVLARYAYGTRLSQFLDARVAVGHWALSPHVDSLNPRIDRFMDGDAGEEDAQALIDEVQPRFIYVDRPASNVSPSDIKVLEYRLAYENPGVQLFERAQ